MPKESINFKDILQQLTENQFNVENGMFEQASKDYFKMLRTMVDGFKVQKVQGITDEEGLKEYFARETLFMGILAMRMSFIKCAVNAGKAGGN